MQTIAFIALTPRMQEAAREILRAEHPDVLLAEGLMDGAADTARALADRGVEVVISRGATARRVQDALPDLSVVDISTSSLDLLTALHKARERARRVAVVAFPPMSDNAVELGRMLGAQVDVVEWETQEGIVPALLAARERGADMVVGGYIMALYAARLGIPCQPVEPSPASILAAVREAKRIAHGRSVEKAKNSLLRAVLTSTDNGIVAVDRAGRVTVCNPVAGRLLRLTESDALGRPVDEVWPRSGLERVLSAGRPETARIERVFDQELLCGTLPLTVRGETVGAVATIHDAQKIRKLEATLRLRGLASGHVATARLEDAHGESPALAHAVAMARDYARTGDTVLLHGETGTGKELFAQGIHNASPRRAGPFVAVNCAALPGQLLESELFGYVPGAFTGASQKGRPGLFELAHGGTIFLDEIAEMEPGTQGKLLRVLQERKVMRLGSDQVIPVDVRAVAATNRDLGALVAEGRFRADLYYRLNVLRLRLPPLRARSGDVPGLAARFLDQASGRPGRFQLSGGALRALAAHPWPGNVRELQNVMARVAATHRGRTVDEALVRELLDEAPALREGHGEQGGGAGFPGPAGGAGTGNAGSAGGAAPGSGPGSAGGLRAAERARLEDALSRARGRVGEAAALLGVSRSTLWRRMRALGLEKN
ncbi:Arginine utilization regulatory protein RocR [Fundidesulfovibrio magnetotacticus]|uniref:Arginine utilization regulatory protein RocR n=1 Tax=Fundidesulfovibrio magnetotacticus TaxID=2730080 RepID=A0A6V8LUT1_9BACT|nr:sigma 54-interacting transcriptional regulator [Fundidesulfovibrio magnetotacticus]GFK93417.1 Arginine utilization regulatory protein RocR [Fundidesulfovibrio magnetotacticus]